MNTGILVVFAAVMCAAVAPVAAQQASESVRLGVSVVPAPPRATSLTGPRLSPQFQHFVPRLASSAATKSSSSAVEGGQHTIVISTLALVLAAIIVVLLAVN